MKQADGRLGIFGKGSKSAGFYYGTQARTGPRVRACACDVHGRFRRVMVPRSDACVHGRPAGTGRP
eukprot:6176761-Pleurochrysis_carterae.AAC.2